MKRSPSLSESYFFFENLQESKKTGVRDRRTRCGLCGKRFRSRRSQEGFCKHCQHEEEGFAAEVIRHVPLQLRSYV